MSKSTIRWSDHGSFAVIPEWILDADVSDRAVRLFGVLGRYANDSSLHAMPNRKTLATRLRCATSTLDAALLELREIGALSWTAQRRKDGGQGANEYVLHPTPLAPGKEPPTDGSVTPPTDGSVGNEREHVLTREERTASSPPLVKIGGQNLGFNALAAVCGVDVRNRRRVSELTGALKEIRGYFAADCPLGGETFERTFADEIAARAERYRRRLKGAELTPSALAKWWHDVAADGRTALSESDRQTLEDIPDL